MRTFTRIAIAMLAVLFAVQAQAINVV